MNSGVATDVSVIICTRNRAAALKSSLDALQRAIAEAPEIRVETIVVDNGSTDETASVVAAWVGKGTMNARLVEEPRVGLAVARNTGLSLACGNLIVLTDDDCCLAIDYFRTLTGLYAGIDGGAIFGGRVELGDASDLPITIKVETERLEFDGMGAGGFLLGCNMTFNRATFDQLGLMDERFGAGTRFKSGEDTDYIYRAFLAGIPVIYAPELCVTHFHGRRGQDDVRKLFLGYNIGNGALFAKHFSTCLSRQLRWNITNAFREIFGQASFQPELGLTYRYMVWGNLRGLALYGWHNLVEGVARPRLARTARRSTAPLY